MHLQKNKKDEFRDIALESTNAKMHTAIITDVSVN
jgi:hypothetical protein